MGGLSHPKMNTYVHIFTRDQDELEEPINKIMIKFKWLLVEFATYIPKELYDKVSKRWMYALHTEKKMRER